MSTPPDDIKPKGSAGHGCHKDQSNPSSPKQSKPKQKRTDVGYGRPPPDHQFKPGQSGNPKGRPKGLKNESTILKDLLKRKVATRESGRLRRVTIFEAIYTRITEDALHGNLKSAAFLLNRYGNHVSGTPLPTAMDADDQEILDAYLQRVLADQEVGK
jgi:hypothetical protein